MAPNVGNELQELFTNTEGCLSISGNIVLSLKDILSRSFTIFPFCLTLTLTLSIVIPESDDCLTQELDRE